MLYTEDFTMRHYVGFSQIGSQLSCQSLLNSCDGSRMAEALQGNNSSGNTAVK